MASRPEFVQYAADQMAGAGNISYKKMFGEYGFYCDARFFGVICENQLFVKITKAGERLEKEKKMKLRREPPYEGAKPHFLIEDIEDREFLAEFIGETCKELPPPKEKKKKSKE